MIRRGLALGLVAAAALTAAAPAYADAVSGTTIDYVERTDEGLQILVSVPPEAEVDTENVSVSIDLDECKCCACFLPMGGSVRVGSSPCM